jgi:hypothetical protein
MSASMMLKPDITLPKVSRSRCRMTELGINSGHACSFCRDIYGAMTSYSRSRKYEH